jgi:hypothetical protein
MRLHSLLTPAMLGRIEAQAADSPHASALIAHFAEVENFDILAFYGVDHAAMDALVAEARSWCRAHRCKGEQAVRRIALMFLYLGYHFQNDPRYSPLQAWLSAHPLSEDDGALATLAQLAGQTILHPRPDMLTMLRHAQAACNADDPRALNDLARQLYGTDLATLRDAAVWGGAPPTAMSVATDAFLLLYGPAWFRAPLHGLVADLQLPARQLSDLCVQVIARRIGVLEGQVARAAIRTGVQSGAGPG